MFKAKLNLAVISIIILALGGPLAVNAVAGQGNGYGDKKHHKIHKKEKKVTVITKHNKTHKKVKTVTVVKKPHKKVVVVEKRVERVIVKPAPKKVVVIHKTPAVQVVYHTGPDYPAYYYHEWPGIKLVVRGELFYRYQGDYYKKMRHGYVAVNTPYGAYRNHIPRWAKRYDHNGRKYWVYDGTYYRRYQGGFRACHKPWNV